MSNTIEVKIDCIKGVKGATADIPMVELIEDAYKNTTGKDDFDLKYFDIFLDNTNVNNFIDKNTTLDRFLYSIKQKYTKARVSSKPNIVEIIKNYNSKKYSFFIKISLQDLQTSSSNKDTSSNKKARIEGPDYNVNALVDDKVRKLRFIFSNGVEFIQYIMKQHVFDKLHDTIHSRCIGRDGKVKNSFDSIKPITPDELKKEICIIRQVLRSPLNPIFTHFINSTNVTVDMGRKIIGWIIDIFSIKSIKSNTIGKTKEDLKQNMKSIIEELNKDESANCGDMETRVLAIDMKKVEAKPNIAKVAQGNNKSRVSTDGEDAIFVENAPAVKPRYIEHTIVANSVGSLIDGASNDTSGEYLYNAMNNPGNEVYTKCTPYEYYMYWEEDRENFYQKIEIELKKENGVVNGKIDITITLCIGGHEVHSTIENYDLFSNSFTRPTYENSDSIIEMITERKAGRFNVNDYDSTQHFGKPLGDFLKNMEFFSLVGHEYTPFNEKSVHNTDTVAIGATDRLASCIAIELATESSYKVRDTKVAKVIVTARGHISTIVTLFLKNIEKITDTDTDTEDDASVRSSSGSAVVQGLSTTSHILPDGFEINESTIIKDNYSLFRSLLYATSTDDELSETYRIIEFKGHLLKECTYQLDADELEHLIESENIERRRIYMRAFSNPNYRGGFFEIQVFATMTNNIIIVHDYSDDIEELHKFEPITRLFKPNTKYQEPGTIHLYYDGTHYSLLNDTNTNSGGGSRKYSKSSEVNYKPNIDLSTITDLNFVLWFNPLNPEHLERFENHKKAFNDFLLFLNTPVYQNRMKNKIIITFEYNNKKYSFFTSTLHQALMVNQLLLKNVKSMISQRLEKSKTRISKKNPTQNKIRNISRSKIRISMQSKNRNISRNKRNPTNAMIRNNTTRKNSQPRQFLPFFY
jgi:hypothetical protein